MYYLLVFKFSAISLYKRVVCIIYMYMYRFSVISLLKRVISYLYICIIIVLTQRAKRAEYLLCSI
uniref:Uncharacterized protein n=1 Tax=Myoviridae sp. ctJ2i1 TaxID=2825079 RepID=A0A8S5V1Z7_9CAUD|nr:MAG TPA: hypothetical protein [Myoviridae sp. ctJ2i1]